MAFSESPTRKPKDDVTTENTESTEFAPFLESLCSSVNSVVNGFFVQVLFRSLVRLQAGKSTKIAQQSNANETSIRYANNLDIVQRFAGTRISHPKFRRVASSHGKI
jgi:hypothetical protein